MTSSDRRIAILAEGTLDFHFGKTAISILRYMPQDVVAVIDAEHVGMTAHQLLGVGGPIPICRTVAETLPFRPTQLLIGVAPRGGNLPPEWRGHIVDALNAGLDVVSGLHFMLGEDPGFQELAKVKGCRIEDVRRAPDNLEVAELRPRRKRSRVVTFVGSDCAVGKMTAALEMRAAAKRMGIDVAFVATGQTGIMLAGHGISVDRVVGDFMAGAVESLVVEAAERADLVLVEGQGSLLHPGYSGVTLALLHGSSPDALVLVHPPSRRTIDGYGLTIPPVERLVAIYEEAASWIKPARVAAIALNTRDMNAEETDAAIRETESRTGLPATDPVKFGGERLIEATVDRVLAPSSPSV